jgi:glycosyltransferase involved in cell wall biosynthesis
MKTVCLDMIVKNESRVIQRCLESVKTIVQYWVIVDTGSTDGTKEIVRDVLKDVPGELYERPWVDFAHNRNEALFFAKGRGDYLLLIDADERLEFTEPFAPKFNRDLYYVSIYSKRSMYHRACLIDNRLDWYYKGVVHEQFLPNTGRTTEVLKGVSNISMSEEGARGRDPNKYLKDAALLEKALQNEPDNPEYVYYLAQSYGNANDCKMAFYYYQKRAGMGGCPQCVYYSLYISAIIQDLFFHADTATVEKSYWEAFEYRPSRAEPLYRLAEYYLRKGDLDSADRIVELGLSIPLTSDGLNVETGIYESGFRQLKKQIRLGDA